MKRELLISIIAIISLCAVFFAGMMTGQGRCNRISPVASIDTLIVRDTIIIERPVPVLQYRDTGRLVQVVTTDTIMVRDSIFLPMEVKIYEDSLYRAQVSGYRPALDWVELYQATQVVTIETVGHDNNRFGIGLQAGFGANYNAKGAGFGPYIGLGVTFNLFKL